MCADSVFGKAGLGGPYGLWAVILVDLSIVAHAVCALRNQIGVYIYVCIERERERDRGTFAFRMPAFC